NWVETLIVLLPEEAIAPDADPLKPLLTPLEVREASSHSTSNVLEPEDKLLMLKVTSEAPPATVAVSVIVVSPGADMVKVHPSTLLLAELALPTIRDFETPVAVGFGFSTIRLTVAEPPPPPVDMAPPHPIRVK
ncbi:MAG: hypothetical protein U1D33_03395, partial [bacterium]|nr:hypothetical protein [bacterium]